MKSPKGKALESKKEGKHKQIGYKRSDLDFFREYEKMGEEKRMKLINRKSK